VSRNSIEDPSDRLFVATNQQRLVTDHMGMTRGGARFIVAIDAISTEPTRVELRGRTCAMECEQEQLRGRRGVGLKVGYISDYYILPGLQSCPRNIDSPQLHIMLRYESLIHLGPQDSQTLKCK
jgi:hypothetical protein